MEKKSTDQEWMAWVGVQREILRRWVKRDLSSAVHLIDEYLAGERAIEIQADALAFRGRLRRELRELDTAKKDYLEAQVLSDEASYRRYTIEISLGSICEDLKLGKEAESWYLRAMWTAVSDPTTSGASALEGFLDLKGTQPLNNDEMDLCIRVVRQAWALFRLPGEPDLSNLRATIEVLNEAATRPLPGDV